MNQQSQPIAFAAISVVCLSVGIVVGLVIGDKIHENHSEVAAPDAETTAVVTSTDDKKVPPRYEKFINGDGVLCMRDNHAGGLSCDFAKFNAAVKACEEAQLAKNTYIDENGEEVVFPLVEGECEAKVKTEAVEDFELKLARSKIVWH